MPHNLLWPAAGRRGLRPVPLLVLLTSILALLLPLSGAPAVARAADGARKIVLFNGPLAQHQPEYEALVRAAGGTVAKPLPLVDGLAVQLPDAAAVRALESRPEVRLVEDDAVLTVTGVLHPGRGGSGFPQPPQSLPWGVDRIDAEQAWIAPVPATGTGVRVAVLDTGIDLDHPDLQANVAGGYNAIAPATPPTDRHGHGTHVAGTIAAVNNAIGVVGVAPAARLYAVKVINDGGFGLISDVIEGIDWSIRNGMQVINMSFGSPGESQAFHDAVTKAYQAGITLVAAAGNAGPSDNTVLYPARYPEVIAVAATDQADGLAWFSSRGPEVDLAAPGVDVLSTYLGGRYVSGTGTSMAAPHVTGTAALVLGRWGAMPPDAVRAHLVGTAAAVPTAVYPLVDALQAVSAAPAP